MPERATVAVAEPRPWQAAGGRAYGANWSLETIEEIYRRHSPRFRRVALAILHDPATAEDVVQDAFATAVARRHSLRRSGAEVGWLWRIVVNASLSRRRHSRVEICALEQAERFAAGAVPVAAGSDERVRSCVARLPERQKLALFLRYYADLDYGTIADVLSIAPGTVGKLLHDARATIREALDGDADE